MKCVVLFLTNLLHLRFDWSSLVSRVEGPGRGRSHRHQSWWVLDHWHWRTSPVQMSLLLPLCTLLTTDRVATLTTLSTAIYRSVTWQTYRVTCMVGTNNQGVLNIQQLTLTNIPGSYQTPLTPSLVHHDRVTTMTSVVKSTMTMTTITHCLTVGTLYRSWQWADKTSPAILHVYCDTTVLCTTLYYSVHSDIGGKLRIQVDIW